MIKRTMVILGVAAIILTGACSSDNGGTSTTGPRILTPERSDESGVSKAFCDDKASIIGGLFTSYAQALEGASGTQAEVQAAVSSGRKLIELGRTFINVCGHFYSDAQIDGIASKLDTLEDTLNQAY